MAKVAILFFVGVFSIEVHAAQRLVLKVEKSGDQFRHQNSLIYEGDTVYFSRNSNFVCGPQKQVFLGSFKRKETKEDRRQREWLQQIKLRLKTQIFKPADPQHGLRTFIDSYEVTESSPSHKDVLRVVEKTCDSKEWIKEQSTQISLDEKAKTVQVLNLSQSGRLETYPAATICQIKGEMTETSTKVFLCTIPNHGLALLVGSP